MYRGKVIGNVVATIKDPNLTGMKFLVVQLIDDDGNPIGDPIVAADAIRVSGEGDEVYLALKREAAIAFPPPHGPIDAAITGFVDEYFIVEADKYRVSKKKPKPIPEPPSTQKKKPERAPEPPPTQKVPSEQEPEIPPKSSIAPKKKRPEAEIRSPLPQNEVEEDS
ncbi:MAG: EutN/CcmL family microcompartment protein [Candidatus Hodarchaeales archaeon]|jgi:microcompartment protein CcmK/EutM